MKKFEFEGFTPINFKLKEEVKYTMDIVDDIVYESEEIITHLMSDPSEMTLTLEINGQIFTNCSFAISKDGKRMEWFNDEHNGVIEIK